MLMQMRRVNDEVYFTDEPVVQVSRADLERLKGLAAGTRRRRVRLCAHRDTRDAVHEMLIVLDGATYVRPHRHRNKSESFHVVEGALSVAIFDEAGQLRELVRLGEYGSGRAFYCRLAESAYHAVLVETASAVIHETTNGPFDPADTTFATWAPAEDDVEAARQYRRELAKNLGIQLAST